MVDNSGFVGGGGDVEFDFTYGESINANTAFDLRPDGKIYKSGVREGIVKHAVGHSTGAQNFQFNSFYIESINVIAIVYRDGANNNYLTLILGEIGVDKSITWCDTPVVIDSLAACEAASITYDENLGRLVVAYSINTLLQAIVGTISGSGTSLTCSFGANRPVAALSTAYTPLYFDLPIKCVYDPDTQRVIFGYGKGTSNHDFTARVGQVSTSPDYISFGAETTIASGIQDEKTVDMIYDTVSNKVIAAYQNSINQGVAEVGTVTGGATNSISFGTAYTGLSNLQGSQPLSVLSDTVNSKIILTANKYTTSTGGAGYIGLSWNEGTISGTTISFGTAKTRLDELIKRPFSSYGTSFRGSINADTGEVLLSDTVEGSSNNQMFLVDVNGNVICSDNYSCDLEASNFTKQMHYIGDDMFLVITWHHFLTSSTSSSNNGIVTWKTVKAGNGSMNINPRPTGVTKESGVLDDVKTCSLMPYLIGHLDKADHTGLTPGCNYYAKENGLLTPNSQSWKNKIPYTIVASSTFMGGGQIRTQWETETYYGYSLSSTKIIRNANEVGSL